MTEHFWQSLTGYFTWPEFYTFVAIEEKARQLIEREITGSERPSRIVEVGVHSGQSLAHLGVEMMNAGALAEIDGIDRFGNGLEPVFKSLEPIRPVLGRLLSADSAVAAKHYADGALDVVFIDADHDYAAVSRDIDAWRPKVRPGGILGGHDFTEEFPGVARAVIERFARFHVWRCSPWGPEQRFYPVWWVTL